MKTMIYKRLFFQVRNGFKFFFLASALLRAFAVQATVLTVSNNPPTAGQYTDLQVAVNSANEGDTLLLHGSPNNYGGISMNKKLCLIGAGYIVQRYPIIRGILQLVLDKFINLGQTIFLGQWML